MRLAACSWSLIPLGPEDLCAKLDQLDLRTVQLALDPLRIGEWDTAETVAILADRGVEVCSGMMAMDGEDYSSLESIARTGGVRVDETWEWNREAAAQDAALAGELGLPLVSFHAGFLPHGASDPERGKMISRIREVADLFAAAGVALALETGQESAQTLVEVLQELDHPNVGVNFDPANMILYGMGEPVSSLRQLLPWVRQLHAKDALASATAGVWGEEVTIGTGAVPWRDFLQVVHSSCADCDLVLEREAGANRVADLAEGRRVIEQLWADLTP